MDKREEGGFLKLPPPPRQGRGSASTTTAYDSRPTTYKLLPEWKPGIILITFYSTIYYTILSCITQVPEIPCCGLVGLM